jgi:hypothetical protein
LTLGSTSASQATPGLLTDEVPKSRTLGKVLGFALPPPQVSIANAMATTITAIRTITEAIVKTGELVGKETAL